MSETPPSSSSDKVLIILCHLSWLFGVGFVLPLIVYLATRSDSSRVPEHAREALNFHLSLLIYFVCSLPLFLLGIGFLLAGAIAVCGVVFALIAALKASKGEFYRYPWTIRLIPA